MKKTNMKKIVEIATYIMIGMAIAGGLTPALKIGFTIAACVFLETHCMPQR